METATQERLETGASDADVEAILAHGSVEPVCGWLVCIEGARAGKDYKIRDGKNFIGRADDMDIQILGDNQIVRRNHAVIAYDKKKRESVMLPGDSNGIAYVNDTACYVPVQLEAYNIIEMGESKFLFVPFCGDNFSWWNDEKSGGAPSNE